jgi:hypothetical protein
MGWQPTPEIGELPHGAELVVPAEIRQGPAARGCQGGVLEHEEAVGDRFEGVEENGAHQKWRLHGGDTLSVGTCQWWLGTLAGATGFTSGEHHGAEGMLRLVVVRSDGDRRRAATGRTSVADGGTSATPHSATAGLSDEALVDDKVGTGVRRLDGA